ncbi:MAG: aminotransferase class III-fold pyridoxal phosphate-dependent enzyme [Acidimicrobiia bacterium]|nr:aminotransferase class III-fold pyridoxal phosphate-dependent enzyme [Acidimicrobiia bacterium]
MSALLHPFAPPAKTEFLNIVRGEGAVIWDDRGKAYIDGMASLWYQNIGHGRPEMTAAITEQMRKISAYHLFDPFTNEPAERLADRILTLSPFDKGRVFFGSSGSEAVDSAMKIARIAQREAGHPERHIIISRDRGYHGVNYGGTSAQGIPINQEGFGPLVGGVIQVPADNIEMMSQAFQQNEGSIAAILTEPMQGAGGVFPPPPGYLESLRRLCDQYGAYLIFDEVITGFGRLGSWFGAQRYGVMPDMMTFAKAVTSGYVPLGGVIVGPGPSAALEANPGFALKHGYTYSGHQLAVTAGLTAIAIQEDEQLLAGATRIGERVSPALKSILADGLITEVRGEHGVWAVQLPDQKDAATVRNELLEKGVIYRPLGNALVLCPPLVITDAQIDQMMDALVDVLS